jgi:hypothetical protein
MEREKEGSVETEINGWGEGGEEEWKKVRTCYLHFVYDSRGKGDKRSEGVEKGEEGILVILIFMIAARRWSG